MRQLFSYTLLLLLLDVLSCSNTVCLGTAAAASTFSSELLLSNESSYAAKMEQKGLPVYMKQAHQCLGWPQALLPLHPSGKLPRHFRHRHGRHVKVYVSCSKVKPPLPTSTRKLLLFRPLLLADVPQAAPSPSPDQAGKVLPGPPPLFARMILGFGVAILVVGVAIYCFREWQKKRMYNSMVAREKEDLKDVLPLLPRRFSFKELYNATRGFAELLGSGACSSVYAGVLSDGQKVAVKLLQVVLQETGQSKQFLAEMATVGRTGHYNIVRLVGFCWEATHRLLVYEYLERGSLDRWIFADAPTQALADSMSSAALLDWRARYNIALGIARGLSYLHEECEQPILHFDIKPQNILLGENFEAKLADFGMSRLIERDMSSVVTRVRGTPGYIAPEWYSHGAVGKKSDVYSMGMVFLELVGGRKNLDFALLNNSSIDPEEQEAWHFPTWAAKMCEKGLVMELVDRRLHVNGFDADEARRLIFIALWCIHESPAMRPSAPTVVQWLECHCPIEQPPFSTVLNAKNRVRTLSISSGMLHD